MWPLSYGLKFLFAYIPLLCHPLQIPHWDRLFQAPVPDSHLTHGPNTHTHSNYFQISQWTAQLSSVAHVWLCNPIDCSTPSFPVHHQLPEFIHACPLSQWCHATISSSVVPFFSCLQYFPASGSFTMSQFFTIGGQSIGVSASASVLPMNIQEMFPWYL